MTQKKLCRVCEDIEHKYKCPQCSLLYCSVACFKVHKDKICEKQVVQGKPLQTADVTLIDDRLKIPELNFNEIETEDTIPKEQLQLLEESVELRAMLNNPHLRNIMKSLVMTNSPTTELDKAMQEPIFTELADKCLAIINNENTDRDDDFPEIEDL